MAARRPSIKPSAPDVVDVLDVHVSRLGTTYRGSVSTRRFGLAAGGRSPATILAQSGYAPFVVEVLDRYSPEQLVRQLVAAAAAAYPRGLGDRLQIVLGAGLAMDPLPGL